MRVIRIFDQHDSLHGSHAAAALMGRTHAEASKPMRTAEERSKKSKPEQTSAGNTSRLTVRQHVFPVKSMDRFAIDGRVSLYELPRRSVRRAKPKDVVFCARRAWDQRAENGYMKQIEDEFQTAIGPVIEGNIDEVVPEQKPAIGMMYALWFVRSRYRSLDDQQVKLNGIVGDMLTKEQEETLERKGCAFTRVGGLMPARVLNGAQIQMRVDSFADELAKNTPRWGVIRTQSGEFIVPDVPSHNVLPISPHIALIGSHPDGIITDQNLGEVNRQVRDMCESYYFGRDLSSSCM